MDRLSIAIVGGIVALAGLAGVVSNRAAAIAVPAATVQETPVAVSTDRVTIKIAQGETPALIARKLEQAGVIGSAEHFSVLAGLMGVEKDLSAGDYDLSRGMPTAVVIDRLRQSATQPQYTLTIPEGWRLEQVGEHLQKKGVASAADFQAALAATDYDAPFLAGRPAGTSLEGYLFPDTYFFTQKATAHDIVARLLKTFGDRFPPEMQKQAQANGLSTHQAVTLASIVEREAQLPEERPIIASVYLNRIKENMLLQADPTVQYALAADPASVAKYGWWKRDLTEKDLKLASPYNTYLNRGLPPNPIASPGAAALKAVAQPAQTKYLFFVAKNDGSHAFAETLEEHNRNVAKYQP